MADGIRFAAESPDWRRGLLWDSIQALKRKRRGYFSRCRRRPGVGSRLT